MKSVNAYRWNCDFVTGDDINTNYLFYNKRVSFFYQNERKINCDPLLLIGSCFGSKSTSVSNIENRNLASTNV